MKLKIVNLDCASCATKIEKYLQKNDIHAEIDYLAESITVDTDDVDYLNKLVRKIEPDVSIIDINSHSHDHQHGEIGKLKLSLFVITFILLIIAYFTDLTFIYFIAYITGGYSILYKTFLNVGQKQFFDENLLMSIATFSALLIGEYTESIIILIFFQIGEYFEDIAVNKSKKSIEELLDNREHTLYLEDGKKIDVLDVRVDDIILIKPNEVISLDGDVLDDNVELDESSINGESKTKVYNYGENVLSGTINTGKQFRLRVTNAYNESYATKITTLIKDAQANKSDTEKFITKFARYYTPIVVILAVVIMIVQLLLNQSLHDSIYTGVIFLVVSCPCALVISIPLGYFGGIGLSSANNILVKGSQYLEEALHITDIAFDKTGTLTDGKFKVISLESEIDEQLFINLVASAELKSSHVIARQIVKELEYSDLNLENVEEVTSSGLQFTYQEDNYKLGNATFTKVDEINSDYTIVYVSKNDKYIGYIELGDQLREGVDDLFAYLNKKNINTHILSGDNDSIVQSVGTKLNASHYQGNLLANDKYNYIKNLQEDGSHVLFLGDGVNDAASIVEADIGIAIGDNATTLAVETSDIVLINNTPTDLLALNKISKKTRNIVYQNIILAFGVKAIFLILATFGIAGIYEAIFADVGVALLAILNAYRLIKTKI